MAKKKVSETDDLADLSYEEALGKLETIVEEQSLLSSMEFSCCEVVIRQEVRYCEYYCYCCYSYNYCFYYYNYCCLCDFYNYHGKH